MATSLQPQARGSVRFGRFELNAEDRRLTADGETLKLQEKPYQILIILLARPGKPVSREQLRLFLWSADTYVDFEAGLNTAMRKLRDCLQDDAKSPTFIETVPRLGYRFIAPVSGNLLVPGLSDIEEPESAAPTVTPVPDGGNGNRKRFIAIGTVLAAAVLVIFAIRETRSWLRLHSAAKQIQSIAVLPFVDLSGGSQQQYFADGVTESLITELQQVRNLRVISKTSSMHYRGSHLSMRQIAADLKVDAVLEGSVTRSGDQVRVTARFIFAHSESQIWSRNYDIDMRDILKMQDQIAKSVVDEMGRSLNAEAQPKQIAEVNPRAYEAYLKGREELDIWTAGNLRASAAYFEEATKLDPQFASAWAGLANDYVLQSLFGLLPPSDGIDRARRAAQEAIRLDDTISEAHVAMMTIAGFKYDWPGAETEIKRAVSLDPNSAWAHQYYGYLLSSLQRFDEAIDEMKLAAELDPLSSNKQNSLAATYYRAGRYDEALQYFQQVPDPDENSVSRRRRMSAIYERRGNYPQAAAQLIASLKFAGQTENASTFQSEFNLHGFNSAKKRLLSSEVKRLEARAKTGQLMLNLSIAGDYAALGETKTSLSWLKLAVEQQELGLVYLAVDDRFAPLQAEPEFREILRQLNLDSVPAKNELHSSNALPPDVVRVGSQQR